MTILEAARQLGAAIQEDERFIRYAKARLANDNDENLQKAIGEFNLIRMELDRLMSEENHDDEKIRENNEKLRELYSQIMSGDSMVEYNNAKAELDHMLNDVNSVIMQCCDGADPTTVEPEHAACTGSCESCGGCH